MSTLETVAMTEQDARRLTERIRLAAINYTEAKEKLLRLVSDAKEGSAHAILGYKSWQAYLADVLGDEPMRLTRDERPEVVQMLTAEGMSTRAIAPIVGADQKTVVNDRRATEEFSSVDEPRISHGMDGKTRVHQARSAPSAASPEAAKPKRSTPPRSMAANLDDALSGLNLALSLGNPYTDLTPKQQNLLIEKLEDIINRIKGEQS